MQQRDDENPEGKDRRGLLWSREDVVVTSARDPLSGRRAYYVKLSDTGEIFEFGEDEFSIWKEFEGGVSLDAAEQAITQRFGSDIRDRLRTFVADLAMRGLLGGDLPPDLVEDFREGGQGRWRSFLIDPAGRDRNARSRWYRWVICDPNAFFDVLARWFLWVKYLRWPLALAACVSVMILFKHPRDYSADFHATMFQWGRIPHTLFTLFTINLVRVIAQGAVSRHYGAWVSYLSIDLVYGIWPRFHEDKKGILLLERTPQLWSHSAPFFVRLAFFAVGTIGWWTLRGDGSHLYQYCLLASQAAIADFATASLPVFKNETYFWFCALHRDPALQDRGKAALRSMFFLSKGTPSHIPTIEKLALALYGLSMLIALLVIFLAVTTFAIGLTGTYLGVGFTVFVILVVLGVAKVGAIRALKRRLLAEQAERQADRRSLRRQEARTLSLASLQVE
jgi:hypothetical protein